MHIASLIDHTLLKPAASVDELLILCSEAARYSFAAVCVPPPFVRRAKALLAPSGVRVATVVGFPFGYAPTEAKMAETILALVDGADELDMVINLIALRMNDWEYLAKETGLIADTIHRKGKLLKLIIESGILTREEIIRCCDLAGKAGVDFLKTSTGYAEKGASIEAVELMRRHLPPAIKIKASGGIRTYDVALSMVQAGASRLGCSASLAIIQEEPGFEDGLQIIR